MNPYNYITKLKIVDLTPSQESIHQAYIQLCIKKHYELISVTELCKQAHVARTTFYAYYSHTEELLEEIENQLIIDLLAVNQDSSNTFDEKYIINVINYIQKHQSILEILLVKYPHHRLIQLWKDAAKYHFYNIVIQVDEKNRELILEIIANICLGFYTYYMDHPYNYDLRLVTDTIYSIICTDQS